MVNMENYEMAYAEVIEVLNYLPIEEYKKIPKRYITFMEENCSEKSTFVYNIALPFEKQNISDTAKSILGMIFRLFIIDQEKKENLNIEDKILKIKEGLEKEVKYNSNELFEKGILKEKTNNGKEIIAFDENRKSIFTKILNKIKKILKI